MAAPIAKLDTSTPSTSTMTSVSSQIDQHLTTPPHLFTTKNSHSRQQLPQLKSNSKSMNSSLSALSEIDITIFNKRSCLISLWATWYALIVLLLHIYILYINYTPIESLFKQTQRIDKLKSESQRIELSQLWFSELAYLEEHIYFELVSRLVLFALSIVFMIIFVITSLKPLGNYSNDGVKFGRDFFSEKFIEHNHRDEIAMSHASSVAQSATLNEKRKVLRRGCCFWLTDLIQTLWQHFLPISHISHLISILMLLFSKIVFTTWRTESLKCLDNDNTLACLENIYNSSSVSIALQKESWSFLIYQIEVLKFELTSLCLALVSTYIRYGSVFWFTNKGLAFLVTFIGLIAAAQQLLQVYSFIYIFSMIDKDEFYMHLPPNISTQFNPTPKPLYTNELPPIIREKLTLLFLYLTLSLLVYLSATPAYVFSYIKYKEKFFIEEKHFVHQFKHRKLLSISEERKVETSMGPKAQSQLIMSTCCFSYCPHLIATVQLVMMCVCKLPFCFDYIVYYNKSKDSGIMLLIIAEILHIIILIFIWLLLTLKTDWTMHLRTIFSICHWTYHLRMYPSHDIDPRDIFKNIRTSSNNTRLPLWSDDEYSLSKMGSNTNSDHYEFRPKSIIQSLDQYQNVGPLPNSQVPLRRKVVSIKNNTHTLDIAQLIPEKRDWIDARHKSLFVEGSGEYEPVVSTLKGTNSDYMINSETLYRNEIRKSCKNLLESKPARPQSVVGQSGITLPSFNQALHSNINPLLEYENPRTLMEPFFYNNIDQKTKIPDTSKNFSSGLFLTTPLIFDSSTNTTKCLAGKGQHNTPSITKIVSNNGGHNNRMSSKPPVDAASKNKEMSSNYNLARPTVYLERPPNTGNEYESRV